MSNDYYMTVWLSQRICIVQCSQADVECYFYVQPFQHTLCSCLTLLHLPPFPDSNVSGDAGIKPGTGTAGTAFALTVRADQRVLNDL
jgi:hypothetical protein